MEPSRHFGDNRGQRGDFAAEPLEPARQPAGGDEPPLAPSPRSLRGLDWFVFFVADVQTGFGPFVSVFLTTQKWTQVDIGLVLSAAGFVSLIGQIPGGALVDAARSERLNRRSVPNRPTVPVGQVTKTLMSNPSRLASRVIWLAIRSGRSLP